MTAVVNYLDRALASLRAIGVPMTPPEAPVLAVIEKVAKYEPAKVTAIALTLQQSPSFNAAIREQIAGMDISTRYADIADSFNSIREDAQQMAEWMADGKLDIKERAQLLWMKARRGSIPDRFDVIRKKYLDTAKSCNDQIGRETTILDAYQDFRMALKSAEVDAHEVLRVATAAVESCKANLQAASDALQSMTGEDGAERTRLELVRDEALRALQAEDKSYQIVKDIADDLKTSYNTAELVFARLQQTHSVKERLYQRSVTFFSTNEIVLSGLEASFASMSGLSEATNTMEAMKDGISAGLESLAKSGGQQLEAGLRAGYGSTLKVGSVKALAESIVEFQMSSLKLISELRQESTQASNEIEAATENSKRRFTELLNKGV